MREHSRDKVRLVFSQQIEKYLSETDWKTWNNSDWVLTIDAGTVFHHGVYPQFKDVGNLFHAERKMREDTDINFRVCQIGIRRLQIRYGVRMGLVECLKDAFGLSGRYLPLVGEPLGFRPFHYPICPTYET